MITKHKQPTTQSSKQTNKQTTNKQTQQNNNIGSGKITAKVEQELDISFLYFV